MKYMISALFVCLAAPAAYSATSDGSFAVDGPGNQTCEFFAKALKDGDQQVSIAFAAWSQGFITAVNVLEDDTYDITPWQTAEVLMAKLNAFCSANPDVPYVNALGALIATLKPERLLESSELVQARVNGKAVTVPIEVLERVRGVLEQMEAGPIGTAAGSFDLEFAERLRAFQRENGFAQTGLPDQNTLNRMFP